MNYEKLYKEALERARVFNDGGKADIEKWTTLCEYIFPELKESEDEKIRKCLHELLCSEITYETFIKYGLTVDSALDWLEKQGEQKPFDNDIKEALRTEYEKGRADAIAEMQVAWGEEDERMFKSAIALIETLEDCNKAPDAFGNVKFWLKSLKDRVQPQNAWKQQMMKDSIDATIEHMPNDYGEFRPCIHVKVNRTFKKGEKVKVIIMKEEQV